jgi:hypothetical protein
MCPFAYETSVGKLQQFLGINMCILPTDTVHTLGSDVITCSMSPNPNS